jgi:phage repressor protein C with HTH and peptisase S24 domain
MIAGAAMKISGQAARLREARRAAGFETAADAVQRFGWKQSTYLAHENGQNGLRPETARIYAKAFRASAAWLLTGEGRRVPGIIIPQTEEEPVPNPGVVEIGRANYIAIGRYDASFSAGPGSLLDSATGPLDYYLAEVSWLHGLTRSAPEHLAIVRVAGDSMVETLYDGDWVLVDRQQKRVTREGIYALQVGEDAWIKRLSVNLKDKLVRIISDNPKYPMQELPEDELMIFGRSIALVARKLP